MSGFPDVACDLWIIRTWEHERAWKTADAAQREKMVAEEMDNEQAGYCLPDDYTAGVRVHVFAGDDFEVWLGCLNGRWVSPEKVCRLSPLMINSAEMSSLVALDGAFAVVLDGRRVIDAFHAGVHHERDL